MPLSDWLAQEIATAKARMRQMVNAGYDGVLDYDRGYLAALEAVADRLLNEELAAGAADEIQGNVRRFGVA